MARTMGKTHVLVSYLQTWHFAALTLFTLLINSLLWLRTDVSYIDNKLRSLSMHVFVKAFAIFKARTGVE